jgi:hypothetical protein
VILFGGGGIGLNLAEKAEGKGLMSDNHLARRCQPSWPLGSVGSRA